MLASLAHYERADLAPDLLAALTLLVIAVPEQLATSRLAGMPPITGFYAFVAGTVCFALLGSNPQLSVGADSTIAPLFAVGISHLASIGSTDYVDLVGILAVFVGVVVALVGLLRLGWIAEFLSAPIITGFLSGVAVIIVVHQLPDLLGLASPSGSTLHRLSVVCSHLSALQPTTLVIGLLVLGVVVIAERIDRRLPGALVGLVVSTLVVGLGHLERHGVAVLGSVAHGAPRFGLHGLGWHEVSSVAPIAGVVALIVISQSAATTRAFAEQGHYDVDVGRDFLGVGVGSVVAGLVGAFPVNASPARTAAVASASGRTQLTGLVAAAVLICLVPAAGLLHDVPLATLAAVLVFIATRIFHVRDLVAIARFDRVELVLALITLLVVALVGVEQGIAVAVGLAILDRTRRSSRPRLHELGHLPHSTSWVVLGSDAEASPEPGVLALLFATPLWYANAVHFRDEVRAALSARRERPGVVVLDVIGMSDLDFTGSRAFRDVLDDLDQAHIAFGLARCEERVRASLQRSGLLARIGASNLYPSVGEAVASLSKSAGPAADPAGR